jgi:hypothetical protein
VLRWWFPSRHRLCFHWLFLSQRVVTSFESMCHLWKVFQPRFSSRHRVCFHWLFLSQQELRALPNLHATFWRNFGDDLSVGTDFVFVDVF